MAVTAEPIGLGLLRRWSPGPALEWLGRNLAAERERWPLWIPVGIGCGVALYFALPVEPPHWAGPLAVGAAAVLAFAGRRATLLPVVAALAASLAIGLMAAQIRTAVVSTPMLTRDTGPVTVAGRIVAVEPLPAARRLVIAEPVIEDLPAARTPQRVRITVRQPDPRVEPGDRVRLLAELAPPSAPVVPGGYDFQRHMFFLGIGGTGYALGSVAGIEPPQGATVNPALLWLADLRQEITERVLTALPGETGTVAAALMTGYQTAIPKDVLEAMRDSGLAHLLSISGLHIGLVAGILFFGLRGVLALVPSLALARPIKKWAAAAALLGTLFYLLLSGGSVPTQRSFLMTGLVLLAVMLDRSAISMRLAAWAAALLLLFSPDAMVGPSFQMSFAAVVALIAAYEGTRAMRLAGRAEAGWARRLGYYAIGIAVTSLIATLATAPYALYHFNRLANYGIPANMLAVPLTGFWVMPWAILAFLLMPFGLESLALQPMGWGVDGIIAIARRVAAWPGAVVLIPAMPVAGLALVTLGGLWLCIWQRSWRWLGLVPILAGLASILLVRQPDVLVTGDGRLIAVRDANGDLVLSSRRVGRFESDTWLRRAGQSEPQRWPREGYGAGGLLACDALGCLYRAGGHTVAIARSVGALAEDCEIADVVISLEPMRRRCPSARHVIDRFDLWRKGSHALWLDPDGVKVRSVGASRGRRPWVVEPTPWRDPAVPAGSEAPASQ